MIRYRFKLEGEEALFDVDVNRSNLPAPSKDDIPEWTRLQFCQCSNCPLPAGLYPQCPPALDIAGIAKQFSALMSHGEVEVTVATKERIYYKKCDVQTGLSSLYGLILATSGCPHLSRLRGLALFHLPFATVEETLFRTVGSYLLKQYYIQKDGGGGDFDLAGLEELYSELQTLNIDFSKRIKAASEYDANINAVIKLFILSESVSLSLEERLEKLKEQFYES